MIDVGSYLNTRTGPVLTEIVGNGPPLMVVHGGPGMDRRYLVPWLSPFASERRLIFYDQSGCGKGVTAKEGLTADDVVQQLLALIDALELEELGFFGHSWGSHVILSALPSLAPLSVSELILSNPLAFTARRFAASGGRLMSRIPDEANAELGQLMQAKTPEAGLRLMEIALPYPESSTYDFLAAYLF